MYEKIAELISRNDILTAERLLRKYDLSFTLLSSRDCPPFQHRLLMEILYLAELALLECFFGLNLVDARRDKSDQKEAKLRAEKSGGAAGRLYETFEAAEKRHGREEKGWLTALPCVIVGIAVHLAAMVRWF